MSATAYRIFDQDLGSTPVDAETFCDDWVNTSDSSQGWHSLRTSMPDGAPVVHARLPDGEIVRFTGITLYGGTGGPGLTGFTAEHACDDFQILLQGNLNLGLLVLATFKIPLGGGTGYFSREFFARSILPFPIPTEPNGNPGVLFTQLLRPESIDPEPLLGRWKNANFQARGLLELTLEKSGTGLMASVLGTSEKEPIEWEPAEVGVHACLDELGHPSLSALASWRFDNFDTHLQLRVPGGTLAIAGFNEFRDGRMNYATREFFFGAAE